jgi:hypothetical protein
MKATTIAHNEGGELVEMSKYQQLFLQLKKLLK